MAANTGVHQISAAASSLDPARVARFRRVAVPVLVAALAVLAAAAFVQHTYFPERDGPDMDRIIGETYTNVYLYFGAPQHEEDDGKGGRLLHYDEFQVIDGRFEKREFRIFVNPAGRVYHFERD